MKALLQDLGHPIPYTHYLLDLLDILVPNNRELRSLRRGGKFLTRFAVGTRYPGERAIKREAEAAMRCATRVRDAARAILGI